MSAWRDARLDHALRSAPDEDLRPSEATRTAVREMAHRAVAKPAPVPGRWWAGNRMPWNAALATIAVATLVTVTWREGEVPGAKLDPPAPAAAVPPAASPPREAAPERPARTEVGTPRPETKAKPAPAAADQAAQAPPVAAAAPVPAPAPAPAAAGRALSRAAESAPALRAAAPTTWTEARIERGGRSATIAREQSQSLATRLRELAAAQRSEIDPAQAPATRIELHSAQGPLGVFEIFGGGAFRWTPSRAGQPASYSGALSPAQSQQLTQEIDRLLP